MKRKIVLVLAVFMTVMFVISSTKRLMSLRSNSMKVKEDEMRLERLKVENEQLKQELDYKNTQRYEEEEIRNKLGLVKEGESIVNLPNSIVQEVAKVDEVIVPNWKKWQNLFFGS